jgi:hypothetical protein
MYHSFPRSRFSAKRKLESLTYPEQCYYHISKIVDVPTSQSLKSRTAVALFAKPLCRTNMGYANPLL